MRPIDADGLDGSALDKFPVWEKFIWLHNERPTWPPFFVKLSDEWVTGASALSWQRILEGGLDASFEVVRKLQRIAQDPDPVKPRLPYETDDGFLYSIQASGEYWLCIPEAISDEIFEMAHGEGHLGFHRAWQKMRGFIIHKGGKKLRAYIDQCFDAVAIYTCKSTKRIGSTPGKKTWKAYDWATAVLYDLQKGDWGIPVVWISDRNKRFVQGFRKGLFTALRTKLLYTAAYHPSADGQSERSNQTAEIWLRHWQNLHQDTDWDEGLAPMQASLNASCQPTYAVESLAKCHERVFLTHQILDQTYGLERDKLDYIDNLITGFSHLTMVWAIGTSRTIDRQLFTRLGTYPIPYPEPCKERNYYRPSLNKTAAIDPKSGKTSLQMLQAGSASLPSPC
ncbi:hypothetical protein PENFLA_c070G08625 [Penicillium flavigenum]|uniref:Integrase catalytic domain-containing protein n=1 Tax=Penicillium flavigenum TaxID=254877 RepID=A0A1V6SCZ0_9EURO|nr:hypothetical protein PENFLA_c070G08625 [Penicillium flavigenum]